MEKPEAKRRVSVVRPVEFEDILSLIKDQRFRDLLIVSYDCGARPFEVKRLEARHVQIEKHRAVIPTAEAKKGITRAIYFPTERSMEIVRRLVAQHPIGPLFRNKNGNAWTGFAVKNRFEDLQIAIGRREMERQGIESAVTEEAIEAFMRKLPQTKKERKSGKEVVKTKACWRERRPRSTRPDLLGAEMILGFG